MIAHLSGTSLWNLVEERAAASPDAEMLADEHGRRVSFGESRQTEHAWRFCLQGIGGQIDQANR